MIRKQLSIAVAIAVLLAVVGYGLYSLGAHRAAAAGPATTSQSSAAPAPQGAAAAAPQSINEGEDATRRHISAGLKAGDVDPATGRKILYYHDPMVPGNKFDKPGKSPFMDMMLVPVYGGGDNDQGNVSVSPRVQQNLGIRTAEVTEGMLSPQLSAVGSIAFNEREQAVIQARASGFVERLHVRATLDRVARGQVLAELYVPDWVAVQEEFLAVRRMEGSGLASLADAARARMRQAGMSDEQIARVERSGRVEPRVALVSPTAGLVSEIGAREGMAVMPGATLFRINGFGTVWANAEVPETQAALVRPGTRVSAQAAAVPGTRFDGTVQAIVPDVNAATRTIKARIELRNPRGQLVPGMFVTMQFVDTRPEKVILVPTEAVIQTGKRAVVMVAEEAGRFRPVDVQTGIESGGQTEIKKGLQPGQRVVISSQFLIDSEASLRGVETRLNNEPVKATPAATAPRHEGVGKIETIGKDSITLSHGPIASLKWGPMTMDFKLPPANQVPRNLRPGDRVAFEFFMDKDDLPQLTHISPAPAQAAASGATR